MDLLLYHSGFQLGTSNDLMAIWVGSAFFEAIVSGWPARQLTHMRLFSIAYVIVAPGSLAFVLSSHTQRSIQNSQSLFVATP